MPQVSRRHLPEEIEKRIFEIFWKALVDLKSVAMIAA